ncbi:MULTISPECIES: alpha-mannosidase [unclassified Moorena]|uniref:alpha-mannosidase n=1 Tax=unclassified Moorena TaxID=2683338 RepID=UPI0013BDA053|nr:MULTISPECIES: alpha-mannosidase [unclassified Moorena]NER88038.1 alpha-mannosidase [Moorena sp. SIO3A2]NES41462.1 alpha-mannosidase [Moorena sp. SIO2C4]
MDQIRIIDGINHAIAKLRALTQTNVQQGWRYCNEDIPYPVATQPECWENWSIAQRNDKDYITWSAGRQVIWLSQRFLVPQDLQGYPLAGLGLRLVLTWWAESAEIFVNGQLVQEGDLFDSSTRMLLTSTVVPGEEFAVALRLVSPGHDIGGLMRSQILYEATNHDIDPGFVADELAVLQKYSANFEPEKLATLAKAVAEINWDMVSQPTEFMRSLTRLRQQLSTIENSNFRIQNSQNSIQMLGHAHLDLAWLWPVSETWDVAVRTFESVLKLQQEFPDFTFCHTTPALYAWIEQHRPDLFKAIKQQVAAGRWEIVGGMWVEPELNLIDGESIVRQILYGQRYVQKTFGQLTTVAWVTDSFGFCWQLPQLLKQGGIDYFVTQKLHWNDSTKFPYGAFWWQSPDGSQIFSLMSPPNVAGVMDTNPITMASYAIDWEIQTSLKEAFWLPGVGDHGGGPTRDMLQVARRWQQSPFFPKLEFTTASEYLLFAKRGLLAKVSRLKVASCVENLSVGSVGSVGREESRTEQRGGGKGQSQTTKEIPVWNDELYLEFHRGCYTTHADQKRYLRRCEGLLYQAELFAALKTIATGQAYPKTELEEAWKKVLFNQFHDILPGTSIPEVFVDANQAWQEVEEVTGDILEESLNAIASKITLPPPPKPNAQAIIVFNPLNWQRSEVIAISLAVSLPVSIPVESIEWEVYDCFGEKIVSQVSHDQAQDIPNHDNNNENLSYSQIELLFLASNIPSVGYRVFWLCSNDVELTIELSPDSRFPIPDSLLGGVRACFQSFPQDLDPPQPPLIRGEPNSKSPERAIPRSGDLAPQPPLIRGEPNSKSPFFKGDLGGSPSLKTCPRGGYRFPIPNSRFPIPDSRFPIPDSRFPIEDLVLENQYLRVVVDPETGDLSSVFDQVNQREVLSGPGNQLQAFEDSGQYWDAWNIDPNYADHPLPSTELIGIEWVETGVLSQRLRVVRRLMRSQFCQDYILSAESPVLKIATTVDWQERHVLVKAAFPLAIDADYVSYEMPCGVIKRSTRPQTHAEQAKWEVPALRWADLSDQTYGVSLLNDCKYGYDAQASQLRLTLLRSPTWPDPEADQGIHQFTYALYPHQGNWRFADTIHLAYQLNLPFLSLLWSPPNSSVVSNNVSNNSQPSLPSTGQLLNLSAKTLILMALKQSEDIPDQWILRCYESHGESANLSLVSDLGLKVVHPVDLLERPVSLSEPSPDGKVVQIEPWKISSFAVRLIT